MDFGSRQPYSSARSRRGFTLLELAIAMTFVALLAGGIAISISTCLNVWRRSMEIADLNQEARAVIETISRDLRGAHLGLYRDAGFFIASQASVSESPFDRIALTTEGSGVSRAALLPDELRAAPQEERPPISDFVGVAYHWAEGERGAPAGLYRTTWVVPLASQWQGITPVDSELLSSSLTRLDLRYFDGEEWLTDYDSRAEWNRLPAAVYLQFGLLDQRQKEHDFQTIIPIAAR